MPGPFHSLVESWKDFPAGVGWSAPDGHQGYRSFTIPLDIGGVTIGYFGLRGGCYSDAPERAVMLQLEVGSPSARTRVPLARIDWKPMQQTHKNPVKGRAIGSSLFITGSHAHPFHLNWIDDHQRMRSGNLPFAEPLHPDPIDFVALLAFARTFFRINGINRLPTPEWAPKMLI